MKFFIHQEDTTVLKFLSKIIAINRHLKLIEQQREQDKNTLLVEDT